MKTYLTQLPIIPALNGMRGYIMCSILVWHYFTGIVDPQSFAPSLAVLFTAMRQATSLNWLAMDAFFVLSGFLIGRILLFHRDTENYFAAFYARRALRIFPAYYLMISLFFVLPMLLPEELPWLFANPAPSWTYWVYLQNFWQLDELGANWVGATWSLALEEQFYLLFPLVIYLVPRKHFPWLVLAGVVAAMLVRSQVGPLGKFAAYVLLPARMDALLIGALVAWLSLYTNFSRHYKAYRWHLLGLTSIAMIAIPLSKLVLKEGLGGPVIHLASSVLSALLIAWAIEGNRKSMPARLLSNRFAQWLANISYMLYLCHQPALGLCHGLLLGQAPRLGNLTEALVTVLALVIALVFSTVSFYFFESPLVNIGKRIRYRMPGKSIAPVSAQTD